MDAEKSLVIKRKIFYEMFQHCMQEHPLSACGILAGIGERAELLEKLSSVAEQSAAEVDSIRGARTRLEERGVKPFAHFRSHFSGTAVPTLDELDSFTDPELLLVIVSLQDGGVPMAKAYDVSDGRAIAVRIEIE